MHLHLIDFILARLTLFDHGLHRLFDCLSQLSFHLATISHQDLVRVFLLLVLFALTAPYPPCFSSTVSCRAYHLPSRFRHLVHRTFVVISSNVARHPCHHQNLLSFRSRFRRFYCHLTPVLRPIIANFNHLTHSSSNLPITPRAQSDQSHYFLRLFHRPFPYHQLLNLKEAQHQDHRFLLNHRSLSISGTRKLSGLNTQTCPLSLDSYFLLQEDEE